MTLDTLDPGRFERLVEDLDRTAADLDDRPLRCAACAHPVTETAHRISVAGRHEHRCTNPHGFEYRIGCFRAAGGCTEISPPTSEWTWFKGFHWRIAVCRACGTHLGWGYAAAGGDRFFGLLLDRLVEKP